ncbi:MAG TPA: methyltransferase domain-containing protein [Chitinophagaceae bacterium]|nr:methyltransferase domain-containing protein [Chitinophagaceae bacterium]
MSINDFHYNPEVYHTESAKKVVPLLIEKFHPVSVIDIGCGNAGWLKIFMDNGILDVIGVDGPWVHADSLMISTENFLSCDLEQPLELNRKFDLALCLETAEHLDEKFAPALIHSLTTVSDRIIFSAAVPGQPGDGHINLKNPDYWSKLFRKQGYHTYDMIRPLIWDDNDIHWWYRQNIFVATRQAISGFSDEEIPLLIHPGLIQLKNELAAFQKKEQKNSPSLFKKIMNRLFK